MRQYWQLWEAILSKEKCKELVDMCKMKPLEGGTIFSGRKGYNVKKNIRESKIAWINNISLTNTIRYYFTEANRNAFGFDIDYIPNAQYSEYSEGSYYNWHHDIDWGANIPYDRKLSIGIQLSDPKDYEGGQFEFQSIESPKTFYKQGSVLVFPSYLVHRVTKITKGTRRSLVNWIEGPRWK